MSLASTSSICACKRAYSAAWAANSSRARAGTLSSAAATRHARPIRIRLSASYEKVGDVQVEQGYLAAALKSYNDALATFDRLAKANPGNAEWQRDLSVSSKESATFKWNRAILPPR